MMRCRVLAVFGLLGASLLTAGRADAACAQDQFLCGTLPPDCRTTDGSCCVAVAGAAKAIVKTTGSTCNTPRYCCPTHGDCSGASVYATNNVCISSTLVCDAGWGNCNLDNKDGCELDLYNDPANCGGCAAACSSSHLTPHCSVGQCDGACDTGFDDCDLDKRSNGCEINLTNDPAHCGACDVVCAGLVANATGVTCVASTCTFALCTTGHANCNKNTADGCEVDTTQDVDHCGGCGNKCSDLVLHVTGATLSCVDGGCTYTGGTCATGYEDCDGNKANGCEGDVASNPGLCNQCLGKSDGTSCIASSKCVLSPQCQGESCQGSAKTCTPSGLCKRASCDETTGACVETNADPGSACALDNACVQNASCDNNGQCAGTALPNDSPCALADCPGTARCQSATCVCDPPDLGTADLSASADQGATTADLAGTIGPIETADLAAPDGGSGAKGADKSGCNALPGTASVGELLLALAALAIRRRPARRP